MKILLDVMSGDNAPLELIRGAALAVNECQCELVLIGNEEEIKACATENGIDLSSPRLSVVHAASVISMHDAPLSVVRDKIDSSMAIGLKMLSENKGDAFVSAGNTGALHAGSTLIVRRIKGINKSAIATVLPCKTPLLMMDSGANLELKAENYLQFAEMGTVYMNRIFGIENPRVGLLNNGAEETKGPKLLQEVYQLLSEKEDINFIGNVEGRDIPDGVCDVLVTDGFTGNIALKLIEGMGSFILHSVKDAFLTNLVTKASALLMKKEVTKLKKRFDASEYGGAPLLGLSKPVIKAHGSSDARAILNAVRQAERCVSTKITYEIACRILPDLNKQPAEPSSGN